MLQVASREALLAEQLIAKQRQADLLLLEIAELSAQLAETNYFDDQGFNSTIDWMRFNCHLSEKAAADRIAVGRMAPQLRDGVQALESGEIGFAHLATMARTVQSVGRHADLDGLLELARKMTPGKFFYECQHYRHSVDAKAYCEEQSDHVINHHLSLSTAESGHLFISGVLDPVGGAAVRTALEPLAQKSGVHDHRRLPQRFADAIVELASAGKPAELQVTATIETLKGLAGAAAAEMEFSLPISSTSVQRMACDCSVTRVLLSQDSLTIDVGRSKRVISNTLRKVLKIRDGHCRWPGCERPASWCDGHHVLHWVHGGETNLGNLILLCRRHHRMVHEGGWQLVKTDDGQIVVIAPTQLFSTHWEVQPQVGMAPGLPRGPD